ncbi:hypothetical protein [Flavobacterium sp. U410]
MKQIRTSKFSKLVAYYLAMMMFLQVTQPIQMYALTSGPTQPEFNAFTPIGTSDMVDLASGDFNYNIPIMDVGGYPINLAYNSGVTMDQEASWVGLGWNLNVGQIERQVRGLPDDFKGDEVKYENDLRDNVTVGMNLAVNGAFLGSDAINLGVGLGVEINNYEGITFRPSYGVGFQLSDNVSVGMNVSSSVEDGASVTPNVGISIKSTNFDDMTTSLNSSLSLGLSSRKGVENLNLSASVSQKYHRTIKNKDGSLMSEAKRSNAGLGSLSGSVSFNEQSYTPSKRIGFENSNFTFNTALGAELFGGEGQVQVTAYGSYQKIHADYKSKLEKAFGYENTHFKGSQSGVLDFNRDNERSITKNTLALPITNYTYDLYTIEGQGVSGMYRPYRSQVSNVYNDNVVDLGNGSNFGVEFGSGNLVHGSMDFRTNPSISKTGPWSTGNNVLPYFNESNQDTNKLDYESVVYKFIGGGLTVDPDQNLYESAVHNESAIRFGITGGNKNGSTQSIFYNKAGNSFNINSKIKRDKRVLRNQVVQKVTAKEAEGDPFVVKNAILTSKENHHTAGIRVLQTDGTTYVYGQTAYNTKKVEATFDVSGKGVSTNYNDSGLVPYDLPYSSNSNSISDRYLNKITTPKYAHSYLLSSVLSSDYEDISGNGPSLDDLGSYTQFIYTITESNYKWRVPFEKNKATYNNGLITKNYDQKGNYIYGEKELIYLDKIITKTHVAFFDLEDRLDAVGVLDENGGAGSGRMKRLKAIRLYSRPEVTINGVITDPGISGNVKSIKIAHFEYDYTLCENTPNSIASEQGKLTLKKVYFTYRGSNMGKYTPYVFTYDYFNPDYNNKGFDIWGNYKENTGSSQLNSQPNNTEFPYVEQSESSVDQSSQAWTLKEVKLPSGGVIVVETESDDYQYVQDKKAMQMFNVIGCGNEATITGENFNHTLYDGNSHKRYLYIKISENQLSSYDREKFISDYLSENLEKPIKFRFLLNMRGDNNQQYEYVEGYFTISERTLQTNNTYEKHPIKISSISSGTYVALPLKKLRRDGGTNANAQVNPIAKTGWGFGRMYLNRHVYGLNDNPTERDFATIVNSLKGSIQAVTEIFKGPNKALQDNGCSRIFKPNKSWVRLENSTKRKYGGGLRVRSIKLSDQWTNMLTDNGGTNLSNMEYGQEYDYNDDNGNSSGVAAYEPNGSIENPWVEPFYNNSGNYAERISAPIENNYVEKPFGSGFFPTARITYSKVTVKNLSHSSIKKHATGKVVSRFYTTYDFPTKVEHTDVNTITDITPQSIITSFLSNGNIHIRDHLTMSQGYSITTNDMNGKIKSEEVFPEDSDFPISKIEYRYNINLEGKLDNNLLTINSKGEVQKRLIGLDYDLINDFHESYSESSVTGANVNLASFIIPAAPVPFPVFIPTVFFKNSSHENRLRTAVTTKHVHQTGILVEKIATDLGSTVSTKNLLWDASSGQVLLTGTVNEYDDHYYTFNYPAYWMYDGMGLASTNIGLEGTLESFSGIQPTSNSSAALVPFFNIKGFTGDLTQYFHVGDELYTRSNVVGGAGLIFVDQSTQPVGSKLWVVGFKEDNTGILLMDRYGNYINQCADYDEFDFKIVRSGYRNLQVASMASVTLLKNPLKDLNSDGALDFDFGSLVFDGTSANPYIVNSSAVLYKDFWLPQYELGVYYPNYFNTSGSSTLRPPGSSNPYTPTENWPVNEEGLPNYPYGPLVNPYVLNIKGDWRAEKSYAYLTGRNFSTGLINNPRKEGFYKKFSPFYQLDENKKWIVDPTGWTFASSVTQYSPYGYELENKDALDRYSSAQYAYKQTLPVAVASNSKYRNMGFESFESDNQHLTILRTIEDISAEHSHTGKKSIKVENATYRSLVANLDVQEQEIDIMNSCPTTPDENDPGETGCSSYTVSNDRSVLTFNTGATIIILGECGISTPSCSVNGNVLSVSSYICGDMGNYYLKISVNGEIMYLYFNYAGCTGTCDNSVDGYGNSLVTSCIHGRNCSSTPFSDSCFN